MITIGYFEFVLTEKREKVVGIEAETRDEALKIIEQLMQENHGLCILGETDRVKTELVFNDDPISVLLKVDHDCAEIRLIILEPEKTARITHARLSLEIINSGEPHLNILRLGENTFLCYGDHGPVNRAARTPDGAVSEIRGTAFICHLNGGDIVDVTEDDVNAFGTRFFYPDEFFFIDGFAAFLPRFPPEK